jgi:hypothetical protein
MSNSVETFIASQLASLRAGPSADDIAVAQSLINNTVADVAANRQYPAQSARDNGNVAYSLYHGDCYVLFNGVMGGAGVTLLQCEQIDSLRFDARRVAKYGLNTPSANTIRDIAECIEFASDSEKSQWIADRIVDSIVLVGDDRYESLEAEWTARGCKKPESIESIKARKLQEQLAANNALSTATVDEGYDDADEDEVPEWMLGDLAEEFAEFDVAEM